MTSNVEEWKKIHTTPVTTLDNNYQKAALSFNQARTKQYFLQSRSEI
jgi:hypothetical protein